MNMNEIKKQTTDFFVKLMNNSGIPTNIISSADDLSQISIISTYTTIFQKSTNEIYQYLRDNFHPGTLYREIDCLQCHHYGLLLPYEAEGTFFLVGPLRNSRLTENQLLHILEELKTSTSVKALVQSQYEALYHEQDLNMVESLLYSFCEEIFEGSENYTQENHTLFPEIYRFDQINTMTSVLKSDSESIIPNLSIDEVYRIENQLLDCIRTGNPQKAEQFIQENETGNSFANIEQRTPDPIRNLKNHCIILNTLCRKSAERGGVPPVYIHQVSSDFALQIERITSMGEGAELTRHMARKYSLLVKNRSINEYSLPVQRIITLIDTDLTANLSLNRFATELNQNACYLSSLFKKETGEALTDYVNSKRIEHALFLLNTTDLQIQTIANSCGIYDLSYFGKLFKKYVNMSPSAYRSSIH